MRRVAALIFMIAVVAGWMGSAGHGFARELATAAAGAGFINADFDSGPGVGWIESSTQGFEVIVRDLGEGVTPLSNPYVAWLGGYDFEQSYVRQDVLITDGAPVLAYWTWIDSLEIACNWDLGRIFIDGHLASSTGLCETNNTGDWTRRTVDLSVFAGQDVTVQFQVDTDYRIVSSQYLDDVALEASPLPKLVVSAASNGNLVRLTWQHAPPYAGYEVWRSTSPTFLIGDVGSHKVADLPPPTLGTTLTHDDAGALGNASENFFYLVRGAGAGITRTSGRTGEYDFDLVRGE